MSDLRAGAQQSCAASGCNYPEGECLSVCRAYRAALARPGWTDADADAARLAMELEALLLSCTDTAAVASWWDSAHDALDLHRQRLARLVCFQCDDELEGVYR